ncbi:MAG: hypothetical protein EBX35_11995 [Planctomycetia bacterium]|nr:hypothetical protein [Planctomycetia bacterium]
MIQHARGGERRQKQAGQEQRAQAEVDQELVVVLEREGREVDVEHHRQDAHDQQHREDRLPDRLEKRVPGDGEKRHGDRRCGRTRTARERCMRWRCDVARATKLADQTLPPGDLLIDSSHDLRLRPR